LLSRVTRPDHFFRLLFLPVFFFFLVLRFATVRAA
jgi:hypothetical protein